MTKTKLPARCHKCGAPVVADSTFREAAEVFGYSGIVLQKTPKKDLVWTFSPCYSLVGPDFQDIVVQICEVNPAGPVVHRVTLRRIHCREAEACAEKVLSDFRVARVGERIEAVRSLLRASQEGSGPPELLNLEVRNFLSGLLVELRDLEKELRKEHGSLKTSNRKGPKNGIQEN